jgi:hypothetical protein
MAYGPGPARERQVKRSPGGQGECQSVPRLRLSLACPECLARAGVSGA